MTDDPHKDVLEALAAKGRLRALASRAGLDFTSNDFLALAESPALRDAAATTPNMKRWRKKPQPSLVRKPRCIFPPASPPTPPLLPPCRARAT
jgi:hypothetical protein